MKEPPTGGMTMTKEEMLALRAMMTEVVQEENQKLRTEMQDMRSELNSRIDAQEQRLNAKIDANSTQLLMQVAELLENQTTKLGLQYEHEVAGKINALNEETDILRDDVKDHEQRIHSVERKVGIAI
jgi:FKBP-type peptidyl-prolyl cis-trans isomerase